MDIIIGVLGVTVLLALGGYATVQYTNWKAGKALLWPL